MAPAPPTPGTSQPPEAVPLVLSTTVYGRELSAPQVLSVNSCSAIVQVTESELTEQLMLSEGEVKELSVMAPSGAG